MKIDKKIIKELTEYLDEFKLTELEYTVKDTKIKVSKNNVSVNSESFPNPKFVSTSSPDPKILDNLISGIEIKSPIIGISISDSLLKSNSSSIFISIDSNEKLVCLL